ncbi:unnamed protein product, partial [Timema podura]|nr:unnamed protein product [Timema podura]
VHAEDLHVVSGSIHLNDQTHISVVKRVLLHEKYYVQNEVPVNDVALLELQTRLHLDNVTVANISLRNTSTPLDKMCRVSGWGYTDVT